MPHGLKGGQALKKLVMSASVAAILILAALVPAAAVPNIYGTGGLMEVPDDTIVPPLQLAPSYHGVFGSEINGSNQDFNFFMVEGGILPNFDMGIGFNAGSNTDFMLNFKYRLFNETEKRPSVTIGLVDAAAQLARNGNPGAYLVFSKTLTPYAEELTGKESKPLRGYLGAGLGVYQGIFVGLDWTFTRNFSVMFEYLSSGQAIVDSGHFNGGIRYAITNELQLDLGFVDFSDFTAGISYNAIKF